MPVSPDSNRSKPAPWAGVVKLVWINLTVLVVGLLLLEACAWSYYFVRKAGETSNTTAAWAQSIPADAYTDSSWVGAGLEEGESTGARWTPFTYWRRNPFAGKYVNVDERGLRRTWNAAAANPADVFMFGGSTMWGTGTRDDHTLASCLSKALAEKFPAKVRVTNFGETGYVSTQETIALIREVQAGRVPAVAIFFDGYNDTYSAFQSRVAGIPQNEGNRRAEFNLLHPSRSGDLIREALKLSSLYKLLTGLSGRARRGSPPPGPSPSGDEKLAADVIRVYSANTNIVESMGREAGFQPLFYWQPTPYTRTNRTAFEQSWLKDPAQTGFFAATYDAIRKSPLASKPSFHYIADVFEGQTGTIYIDYAHATERGNELIARRMLRDVAPLVEKRLARQGAGLK